MQVKKNMFRMWLKTGACYRHHYACSIDKIFPRNLEIVKQTLHNKCVLYYSDPDVHRIKRQLMIEHG